MLLELDSDQRLWRDTARDALAKQCSPALVRKVAEAPDGSDDTESAALWRSYFEQGWTELTDSGEMVELGLLLEELGRATDPTPFLATLTQFTPLAPELADPTLSGTAVYSGVTAARAGEGWILDSTARHVLDGDRAQRLAVVTPAGVFVVDADQVSSRRVPIFDPVLHVAEVTFDGLRVGHSERVASDPERAHHIALTGLALTMVGACQRVLDLVLEHVRSRQQFGVAIGSSRPFNTKPPTCTSRWSAPAPCPNFAALTIAADDPRRTLAAAMAKASAGECQSLVFRHGVQLFGAMGFTWENDVQFALKRAKAGELMLGGAAVHRAQVTELSLAGRY